MRLFARRGYIFNRMRPYKKRHNKFNRVLTILLIFVIIFYSSILFERRIKPTILTIAEAKATHIATRTINETIRI